MTETAAAFRRALEAKGIAPEDLDGFEAVFTNVKDMTRSDGTVDDKRIQGFADLVVKARAEGASTEASTSATGGKAEARKRFGGPTVDSNAPRRSDDGPGKAGRTEANKRFNKNSNRDNEERQIKQIAALSVTNDRSLLG